MGQQQLLLLILGVIIVSVAISLGVYMYNSNAVTSNKDDLLNNLHLVSSDAYAFYMRAQIMGGGAGSYGTFVISPSYESTPSGTIAATIAGDGKSITFVATSRHGYGSITAVLNDVGELSSFAFTGDFQ